MINQGVRSSNTLPLARSTGTERGPVKTTTGNCDAALMRTFYKALLMNIRFMAHLPFCNFAFSMKIGVSKSIGDFFSREPIDEKGSEGFILAMSGI
jgi:hypothetical protein